MTTFETNAGVDCHDFPYLIVGNKSDMEEASHVREKHLDKWMEEQEEQETPRVLKYTETSAKTGDGISKAFETVATMLLRHSKGQPKLDKGFFSK